MIKQLTVFALVSVTLFFSHQALALEPTTLRVEYQSNPFGIDSREPRLSWVDVSNRRAEIQTGYQVLVASTPELLNQNRGDLWDSGKVSSAEQNQIAYQGRKLTSRVHCYWKVKVWDRDGIPSGWSHPATWSMGLLEPADWTAKWIGVTESANDTTKNTRPLHLIRATYQAVSGSPVRDVTSLLASQAIGNTLTVRVDNASLGGDPAQGVRKQMVVVYDLGTKRYREVVAENDTLHINTTGQTTFAKPRYLRRDFTVGYGIQRATVYVTALGLYELRLNGQRVGDHLLSPEWTNYHKRVQYQTFDVTRLVHPGANALGGILGNGWYSGGWQLWKPELRPIYGTEPYLRAQLEIEDTAGNRQIVSTDESWHGTTDGPLQFAGIYEGVKIDARKEMPGWDSPGFANGRWKPVALPPANLKVGELVWQRSEPIRVTQELPAIKVTEPKPGIFVFDLGQNIAGWARLKLQEAKDTEVTLLYNEVLNPDGTVYMDNLHAGHLSTGDRQIDRYVCKDDRPATFEPNFTYHGFRYVEVHGLTHKPVSTALTGRVFHTAFTQVGEFTCSNPLVNRLVQNIQWSQRGNMMGIPTDCSQRDERCGYTGDANFFMGAAVYNFDVAAFYNKWLVDVCEDSQLPGGWFADHAPFFGPGATPNVGWSDGGIFCPYQIYRTYGDTRVIREHYAAMKRCIEWEIRTANPDGTRGPNVGNGDWLNLGGGASGEVIGTSHYAYGLRLMSIMADAIGEKTDAVRYDTLAKTAANAFATILLTSDGVIKNSSQTGYALAFTMGLTPVGIESRMSERFAAEIERFNGHLATGFIGTPRLLPALHLAGHDDLAYQLLLREDFPSWLFPVKNGATTVWERWDGWRPDKGFQDAGMNSFNHYSFGAVGEYLFRNIGGISEGKPGYSEILIQPVIRPGITWANTRYNSIRGEIRTAWKIANGELTLDVTIPANTRAALALPAQHVNDVTESGKPVRLSPDQLDSLPPYIFEIGSGTYHFAMPYK